LAASLEGDYGKGKYRPDGDKGKCLSLGDMEENWGNVYPLLAPQGGGDRGYDLTQILKARNTDPRQMVRFGESFFTSLGFEQLRGTFWERSMLVKPVDHEAVCHASAWDVDYEKDVRLKMCIQINEEDFTTRLQSLTTSHRSRLGLMPKIKKRPANNQRLATFASEQ
jgi:angiotensin-converting enzyme